MTGSTAGSGDVEPIRQPDGERAGSLVDKALEVGAELAGLAGADAQITQGLGGIVTRREALDIEYQTALSELETRHAADMTALTEEAAALHARGAELKAERDSLSGRVNHWGGRLRVLASRDEAPRRDVLAFAAHATGGLTHEALGRLDQVDDAVRVGAGLAFVVTQAEHTAFGRILNGNNGLVIDTDQSTKPIDRVKLPVAVYPQREGEATAAYGWVSREFDGPSQDEDYYASDWILGRERKEEDVVEGEYGYVWCHFNVEPDDLRLSSPARMRVITEFSGATAVEAALDSEREDDLLIVGEPAKDYLHGFVGQRLTHIREKHGGIDSATASHELSRMASIASRLGIAIDYSRIPNLEKTIGFEFF